jgi:Domain of unknown function (DUF4249)
MKNYIINIINNYLNFLLIPIIVLFFSSCEKVIDIDLAVSKPQIVVDAFVTNLPETQLIKLSYTSAYFNNNASPAVLGAKVSLKNESTGKVFTFSDKNNDGNYSREFNASEKLLTVLDKYSLQIIQNSDTLISQAVLNPVPVIDSLSYIYKKGVTTKLDGYVASFWANDLPKRKDFYWIRTSRNGKLINEPKYLNFAWDASYEGWDTDGNQFFERIRKAITPFDEPFKLNEKVKVQLWSINEPTYRFINQAQTQLNNQGLFAQAPTNLKTNIVNKNSKSTNKPVGWFLLSAVSEKEINIKKEF